MLRSELQINGKERERKNKMTDITCSAVCETSTSFGVSAEVGPKLMSMFNIIFQIIFQLL